MGSFTADDLSLTDTAGGSSGGSGPSAFTMNTPASPARSSVALSLASQPSDPSGLKSVAYQYRTSSSTGAWSTACTATAAPYGCSWATSKLTDGAYNLQAVATDKAGNSTTSSTTVTVTLDNTPPTAKTVTSANVAGGTRGKAQQGDSVTFTYSEPIKPSSVLPGWSGASTAVQVQLSGTSATTLTVWNSAGSTQLGLGSLALGGAYSSSAKTVFKATMAQSGAGITVTLGAPSGGTVASKAVTGGTLKWTPSASATDLAGNAAKTTTVSAVGPAL